MAQTAGDLVAEVYAQLADLLPKCEKGLLGPCLEIPANGANRGWAVYNEGEKVCMSPILLPGFNMLPRWLLGATYLIFLCYLFGGVSIAADMFMDGIMQITAIMKDVKRKNDKGETVIVKEPVWNWVVANISLMALGTSAPEIMLSLVEALLTLGKPAGELGPSCIVGSAAYNFLVISAVCTLAIPNGQFKSITQLRVYVVTAIWSMWAYIWMLVVYRWWTPDEVTIAEAFITLGFFFLLIINAYIVDTQPWKKKALLKSSPSVSSKTSQVAPLEMASLDAHPNAAGNGNGDHCDLEAGEKGHKKGADAGGGSGRLSSDEVRGAAQGQKNLAFFNHIMAQRHRARRNRLRSIHESGAEGGAHDHEAMTTFEGGVMTGAVVTLTSADKSQVMFRSSAYSFLESVGTARIAVMRLPAAGKTLDQALRVHWKTEDGDAVAGLDYKASEGSLYFAPGEESKYIEVKIIDDDQSEPDVTFHIVLTGLDGPGAGSAAIVQERVRVTVVDDDDAGLLGFELPEYEVGYNDSRMFAEVVIVRRRGADGRVEVTYETQDETAFAGKDYVAASGKVVLESGERTARVRVQMLTDGLPEAHKALKMVLRNPEGGAELSSRHTTRITIVRRQLTALPKVLDLHEGSVAGSKGSKGAKGQDAARTLSGAPGAAGGAGSEHGSDAEGPYRLWPEWRAQIKSSFDAEEEEDGGEKSWLSCILHYSGITQKVLLACMVPPAEWCGGYPCFLAALGAIIGLVYLINEAGVLFGCIVGLKDIMTGISIVAMGTSLPDTLASRIAAVADPDADNAIGNITGSNSVNVFLGLGLPWVICSCYYAAKGEKYATPAGDLSFSVMLFAIVGFLGIVILAVCRRFGGELGGSKRRQWMVAPLFVSLWLLYLILSGLRSSNNIPGIDE